MTGDKLMLELLLKQPWLTCSAYGPFTEHCERIQKFRETSNWKHLCRNELDKAWFGYDAACSASKHLAKRTISDTILKNIAYEITKNHGYDGHQRTLASMVYKFFNEKSESGTIATSKVGISLNEQLAGELHKPVTKKFKRRKLYSRFKTIFGQQA